MNRYNLLRQWCIKLTLLITFSNLVCLNTYAQPDSAFDDIPLNGIASFEQLRKEYYIGGLYLENMGQSAGTFSASTGKKRMDIRIIISRWSPRRFSQQWNQAILINNDQKNLEKFSDDILRFVDLPKASLVTGDRITIDMDPDQGTTVYINNQRMMRVKDSEFFDVLLNTWIGQRPPSSEFKSNILTLPTDQAGTDLLVRYEASAPTKERIAKAASWAGKPVAKAAAQTVTEVAKAPVEKAPRVAVAPTAETKVTLKRKTSEQPKPKKKIELAASKPIAAPTKPKLEIEKPVLAATLPVAANKSPAKPEPEPKPQKAAPKPETKVAAKAAPKKENTDSLLKVYTSNALKLTYLNTQYPKRAMDLRQEGLVVLRVTVNRKGEVKDIEESTKSKYKLLNKAARKAVKKTEPYPEVPDSLPGDRISVNMPFNFKL